VDSLNGAPGVYSARYAGEQKNAEDNIVKLLKALRGLTGQNNRTARFTTVIALNLDHESHIFEGTVEGEIITEKQGEGGFGYDPIFRPVGYEKTFAELSVEVKNKIGHRGKAIYKLLHFLETSTSR